MGAGTTIQGERCEQAAVVSERRTTRIRRDMMGSVAFE
jgi:hypothetical protein